MHSFPLLDAPTPGQMWLIYVVAVFTIIYAVFVRPRKQKDPLSKLGQNRQSLSRQRDVEKQMENLLVELSEMARQITGQLDTRSAKLELLISEADEKIAALNRAAPPVLIDPPPPAAAGRDIARVPDVHLDDPRHTPIYNLADSGLSAAQIAQRLSRPSGEIELILALRSRK